jgi:hypothetical protein
MEHRKEVFPDATVALYVSLSVHYIHAGLLN